MRVLNAIRDICADAIVASGMPGQVEKGRIPPATPDALPLTCVYARKDVASPTGDPRTGLPEFFHTTTVTFAVFDQANTGRDLEDALGAHADVITAAILKRAETIGQFEGCAGMRTDFVIDPDDKGDPIGQLVIEFDLLHGTRWEPSFADDLTTVTVNEGQPGMAGEITPETD